MFRQFAGALMIWSVLWIILKMIDGVHTQWWMPLLAGAGIGLMSWAHINSNHNDSR